MTSQIGDHLTIDGRFVNLVDCPALPWRHPRLRQRTDREARASAAETFIFSTACWRKYQATWSLDGNKLYLRGIQGRYQLVGDEPLFASWVSQELRVAQGDLLAYVHMGFGSVYEEDVFYAIESGLLCAVRTQKNRRPVEDPLEIAGRHLPSIDTVTPGYHEPE